MEKITIKEKVFAIIAALVLLFALFTIIWGVSNLFKECDSEEEDVAIVVSDSSAFSAVFEDTWCGYLLDEDI